MLLSGFEFTSFCEYMNHYAEFPYDKEEFTTEQKEGGGKREEIHVVWFPSPSPQVLLYDLRSSRPYLVKDHYYGLPIHSLAFQREDDLVLSADSRILKIWHAKDVRP